MPTITGSRAAMIYTSSGRRPSRESGRAHAGAEVKRRPRTRSREAATLQPGLHLSPHRRIVLEHRLALLGFRSERLRHVPAEEHAGLPRGDVLETVLDGVVARVVQHLLAAPDR